MVLNGFLLSRLESCTINIYSATRWSEDEFTKFCFGFQFMLENGLVQVNKRTLLTTKGKNHEYGKGVNLIKLQFNGNNSCDGESPKNFRLDPLHYDDDYDDAVNALTNYFNSLKEGDVLVGVTFGGSKMLSRSRSRLLMTYGLDPKFVEDDRDFIFVFVKGFPQSMYFKTTEGRCQIVFAELWIEGMIIKAVVYILYLLKTP